MKKGGCPFKIGDIIKPLPGRIKSNDYNLEYLKELEVKKISYPGRKNSIIKVKILEGKAANWYYGDAKKGQLIFLFSNAFVLTVKKDPDYEVW